MARDEGKRGRTVGPGAGRNTTHQAEAFDPPPVSPDFALEPDATGLEDAGGLDGFQQPTAMFDRGEFLGELAELSAGAPETRAAVEVEEAPEPKGCRLVVVAGPDIGLEWSFKKAEISIGRGNDNDIDFSDIAVSRYHTKISFLRGKFLLADLGSNNGTFLNGVRIEREELCSGDEIIIGARTMRFVELDVAPATAAAFPVPPRAPEPEVGSVGAVPVAKEPEPGSKVDVAVPPEPELDGPAAEAPRPKRPKRAWFGTIAISLALLVVVAGLGAAGWFGYQRFVGGSVAERQRQARIAFLQGIELVRALRFGDAIVLFDETLRLRPGYDRAIEYRAHAEEELKAYALLETARRLAEAERLHEAIEKLDGIGELSAYAPLAQKLRKEWMRAIAEAKVREAQALFEAGDLAGALDLLRQALIDWPNLPSALKLRADIERYASSERKVLVLDDKKPRPEAPKVAPEMARAIALYEASRISEAIDAAEVAGGPNAPTYLARLRRMRDLFNEIANAHKLKAAQAILRSAPEALALDQELALGRGEVRTLLRGFYADALYLKAVSEQNGGDLAQAFRLLNSALQQQPGHRLSETRLSELSRMAKDLYYQGYVLKDTNPTETRRLFRKITQMTQPDNQYHQWASRWLMANGG